MLVTVIIYFRSAAVFLREFQRISCTTVGRAQIPQKCSGILVQSEVAVHITRQVWLQGGRAHRRGSGGVLLKPTYHVLPRYLDT